MNRFEFYDDEQLKAHLDRQTKNDEALVHWWEWIPALLTWALLMIIILGV
jgi:hypothetical protein